MSALSLQDLIRIEKLIDKVEVDSANKLLRNIVMELDKTGSNPWLQKYISSTRLWELRFAFFEDAKRHLPTSPTEQPQTLDLSGIECPTNLAKAIVFLKNQRENLETTLILDSGSPIENVPRGLKQRGYKVSKRIKNQNSTWQISVSKI
jgi:TusA-related sulfurtransferase